MLLKPGKPPQEPTSYRPLNLLPGMGRVFEKLSWRNHIVMEKEIVSDHQFVFRRQRATTEQTRRAVEEIRNALEEK